MTLDGPPFFIIGSARSGTTLLRLMLNAHRDVAVPPESRFITELWSGNNDVDAEQFLRALSSHKRFEAWDLPIEVVREEMAGRTRVPYAEAIEIAYLCYAKLLGKGRWGDKTPRYVENIPLISKLFPTARFIHLIRDGRNVALSYADVPFGPKNVVKAADLWSKRVCAGYTAGRALERGRYIEIRYEDLVEDAEGEAKDLCDFLDLDFDPGMLDYTERARDAVLPRAAKYNPKLTQKPTSQVRSWEKDMDPALVELFEVVAGDVLSELGYERRFRHPKGVTKLKAALGRLGAPVGRVSSTRKS